MSSLEESIRGAAAQCAQVAQTAASVQAAVLSVRFMLSSSGLSFVFAGLSYQNVCLKQK